MVETVGPPSLGFGEAGAQFEMRGVRKLFGGTVALDGVDLAVRGGEVCALVGQNGAGKSTLMSVLAGATVPDAGMMTLNGAVYAPRDPREARKAGVSMIYQELSLAPHMSVMDNIALGVEPARQGALGALGLVHRDAVRRTAQGRSSSSAIWTFPSTHRLAGSRPRHSNSSRLRARSHPAAACSSSMSRRAAWRTAMCGSCSGSLAG